MRLGWLSDIHLNFLKERELRRFLGEVASHKVDGWLIGGDIGESDSALPYLERFAAAVTVPTYFVLGNHDFYYGSLSRVAARVRDFAAGSERLVWLTAAEPQALSQAVVLIGEDAWGDARYGNPLTSPVELTDFVLIEELAGLTREALVRTLNGLGDAAAARLAPKLEKAAAIGREVVLLTHVPPFREAAWYEGQMSSADWLPWFSCRAVGEVILMCARSNPGRRFLVLCGHTHGSGVATPAPNVTVHTAEARYGSPCVQRILELP